MSPRLTDLRSIYFPFLWIKLTKVFCVILQLKFGGQTMQQKMKQKAVSSSSSSTTRVTKRGNGGRGQRAAAPSSAAVPPPKPAIPIQGQQGKLGMTLFAIKIGDI